LENRFNNNGAFPLAIFEMFVDSSSHNMFPFEFFYAVYSIPCNIELTLHKELKGFSQKLIFFSRVNLARSEEKLKSIRRNQPIIAI
jgi:hypothetical protein